MQFDFNLIEDIVKADLNKIPLPRGAQDVSKWIDALNEEDLAFIKRFVLASGSLKQMAQAYGISYPTVRLRLDRLIEKVNILDEHEQMSRFEQVLRAQHADGKVDMDALKILLAAHKEEMEGHDEDADHRS